jgi:putative radical SAM enzyme (TIGR03279 family)
MAVKITGLTKHSAAERAGILSEDILISVDGNEINDVLDYMFYIAEETVSLCVLRGEEKLRFIVKKSEYDDIGLLFDSFLMDKKQSCRNKCIFCFIDQNPPGMREAVYFKDDDARLSFLHGNYITLTNLADKDIDRIIKMRIGINVSLHTMNPQLRAFMMGNRFAGEKLSYIKRLTDSGINLNIQIVLCPGINDGKELDFTLSELLEYAENINSIACVPVGLTKHRGGLYPLSAFTKESAEDAISIIERWQKKYREICGSRCVFPSDELFIKAGLPIPPDEYYEDYPQYENGVGMIRYFSEDFYRAQQNPPEEYAPKKYAIAVGMSSYPFITRLLHSAVTKLPLIDLKIFGIVNEFFGESITVTGLLTGTDIKNQLAGKLESDRILLLSEKMFKKDTELFLDDTSKTDLEKALSVKIEILPDSGEALFNTIIS